MRWKKNCSAHILTMLRCKLKDLNDEISNSEKTSPSELPQQAERLQFRLHFPRCDFKFSKIFLFYLPLKKQSADECKQNKESFELQRTRSGADTIFKAEISL